MNEQMPLITPVEDSIGKMLMKTLYEEITSLRMPWAITPQQQQQELLDRLRAGVDQAVAIAVRRIVAPGFTSITVHLDSMAVKKEMKVAVSLPKGKEEMHTLIDHVGSECVIVFASREAYTNGIEDFRAQLDQPPLPLD